MPKFSIKQKAGSVALWACAPSRLGTPFAPYFERTFAPRFKEVLLNVCFAITLLWALPALSGDLAYSRQGTQFPIVAPLWSRRDRSTYICRRAAHATRGKRACLLAPGTTSITRGPGDRAAQRVNVPPPRHSWRKVSCLPASIPSIIGCVRCRSCCRRIRHSRTAPRKRSPRGRVSRRQRCEQATEGGRQRTRCFRPLPSVLCYPEGGQS